MRPLSRCLHDHDHYDSSHHHDDHPLDHDNHPAFDDHDQAGDHDHHQPGHHHDQAENHHHQAENHHHHSSSHHNHQAQDDNHHHPTTHHHHEADHDHEAHHDHDARPGKLNDRRTLPTVSEAAIVPIRGFRNAKRRLDPILDPAQRESLARDLAIGVLSALAATPTFVVTDDDDVAQIAQGLGAAVVDDRERSLDLAVEAGVEMARAEGFDRLLIAHADLPFPESLGGLGSDIEPNDVLLVPDRHHDGTNVIVLAADVPFRFAYGPASFSRHLAEARRLGCRAVVVEDSPLGWDIDVPDDLATPPEWGPTSWMLQRQ